MSVPDKQFRLYSARLATFNTPQGKRRGSTQSKKKTAGFEWPHELPSSEALARAGFYYRPSSDSLDNVQCFMCNVKLDGWEPADDPVSEHLAHSDGCAWATTIKCLHDDDEQRDPLSDEMAGARHATFQSGNGWPHEGKKGWKCKVSKMVEAGWAWDPSDDGDSIDSVTCFYCNLCLDGWEPKDDPFSEHKKREPTCRFFALLEHYHGAEAAAGKAKKAKARGKASARSSTASKASRMSVQSAMSDMPAMGASFADLDMDGSLPGADDSIVTTATATSQATATGAAKGRKKTTQPKATAKGTKGRKKTSTEDDAMEVNYPDLNLPVQHLEPEHEAVSAPPKATRKAKAATRQLDSSVVEISHMDVAPTKKATRGRKPKAQKQPEPVQEPEPETEEVPQTPDAEAIAEQRLSEISAQLQDELDHTADDYPLDHSTPVVEAPKPKRGVKRTSDGARKQQSSDSSAFEIDVSAFPKAQAAPKAKRGRKPKQASTASMQSEHETQPAVEAEDMRMEVDIQGTQEPEPEPAAKRPRGRPKGNKNSLGRSSNSSQATATFVEADAQPDELEAHQNEPEPVVKKARGRPKGKKSSDSAARSSQASQVSRGSVRISQPVHIVQDKRHSEVSEPQPTWPNMPQHEPDDIARDEAEIENELERIASEQASHNAMETEQDQIDEYETSPSQGRLSKDSAEIQQLEQELQKETENAAEKARDNDPPPRLSLGLEANNGFTFSPTGSDKENQPSSARQSSVKRPQPPVFMSPTKTTRVPLAPGTPNRSPTRMLMSPSKAQISQLTSTVPWNPVELDTVLLASPQPTPGRVGQQLVNAAGVLTSPEKKMTVERWIRFRAEQSEEILRRRCEQMVAAFEKEGMRGLESLNGINVVG